jgi:NitT/TauT family transport system ATP-binding protein
MDKIVVDSVFKSFSSQRRGGEAIVALDNVALTIAAQEIVCIVGPSGCGKSTLLNLIAGFDTPTSGEIKVNGTPVTGAGPDRIVVFQSPSLFPWMTVMQNITFGPRKRGDPRSD